MTINIKQNLLNNDKPQITTCPKCKTGLFSLNNELDVCLFCFEQLPSPTYMTTLLHSRIGYYRKNCNWY